MDGAIFDTLAHRLYPADGETRAQFVQYDGHWMMNDDGSKRGPRSIEGMLCYVMSNGALRIAEVMEIIGTVAVARIAADGAIRAVPIHELTLKPLAKRDDWPEYIGLWIYNDDGSKVNTSK